MECNTYFVSGSRILKMAAVAKAEIHVSQLENMIAQRFQLLGIVEILSLSCILLRTLYVIHNGFMDLPVSKTWMLPSDLVAIFSTS